MPKSKKRPAPQPKRLMRAHTPAINLEDELEVATEILSKQRTDTNAEFEYALVTTTQIEPNVDPNDEFARELAFNKQAQQAAADILPKLKELGIPTMMPSTYKGEMVKDERQMAKVRDTLRSKKDSIEKSEKMKKLRELKKMGKKIQQEVLKKRSKDKKEFLEKVKKRPVSEIFD